MLRHRVYPGRWGLVTISPFCAKVECYLRLQGLPHETVASDPRGTPYGKLPVIERADGGLVADSGAILAQLEAESDAPLDAGLDAEAAARGHAIRRMVEEHLYFTVLYQRWQHPAGWAVYGPVIRAMVPLGGLVAGVLRRGVVRALQGQGLGRLPPKAAWARGLADLDALSDLLGDQPYFLGDRPRTVDCAVWGALHQLAVAPIPGPLRDRVRGDARLVGWLDRIAEQVEQPRVGDA